MCCGTHIEDQMGETVKSKQPQLSRLERVLLVVTSLLVATIILLVILLALFAWRPNQPPAHSSILSSNSSKDGALDSSLCLSSSCIYTANEIIRALDETQDPCEDFYEFACGRWMRYNPMPDGKVSWNVFKKVEQQNQLVMRAALEQVNPDEMAGAEYKAKMYYDACMDSNDITRRLAEKPLLEVIKNLGGWHLLHNTKDESMEDFDFQVLLQQIQNRYKLGGLFNWAVTEDARNPSAHVIVLDQMDLHLPGRDYYLNISAHGKVLDAYLKYMTSVCVLLGANEIEAIEEMSKVLWLQTDLAAITVPAQDGKDKKELYTPFTIQQWQKEVGFLNWKEFFNDAFKLVGKSISENERIVSYAPEYFLKLTPLIKKYSRTEDEKKTLKSYLMWHVCHSLLPYLSESFRDMPRIYRTELYGCEVHEEPWRRCVLETNNAMGFAVSAMFVREMSLPEAKTQGEFMIGNIRNTLKNNLGNLDWMDNKTRKAAEDKADGIMNMIGYPDYILNEDELNKHYEELVVQPNEYFENNLRLNLILMKNDLKKFGAPVDKNKWAMVPTTGNAYNYGDQNKIIFGAGILQPPFFSSDNPQSVNYGAMGSIIGHMLTHAFDYKGREYDGFGNLNQWWSNFTINEYMTQVECIRNQYSSYVVHGRHLNGRQTLDENVADNGGLKLAFQAYLDYSRHKAKVNITLPGLKYNNRQLFFIAYGQQWCSSMTKASVEVHIERDHHTIPKYRLVGPLSNLREFSEVFSCPVGTRMNPKHKCELW